MELTKPRKPWGEILLRNGRHYVVTKRPDGSKRYHGDYHFHHMASEVLQRNLRIDWHDYHERMQAYEDQQRKAAQAETGVVVRG